MALTIVQIKLSAEAICGVTLEPYLQVRKGTSTTVSGEDVPEECVSDSRYVLRYRWYRSVHRGGQICWVRDMHMPRFVSTCHPAGVWVRSGIRLVLVTRYKQVFWCRFILTERQQFSASCVSGVEQKYAKAFIALLNVYNSIGLNTGSCMSRGG